MCAHAISEIKASEPKDRLYEKCDLKSDIQFYNTPNMVDHPNAQSYIGFVLQSDTGKNIGTPCVVDTTPRRFTHVAKDTLIAAGIMIENIIYRRHYLDGIEKD